MTKTISTISEIREAMVANLEGLNSGLTITDIAELTDQHILNAIPSAIENNAADNGVDCTFLSDYLALLERENEIRISEE